MCGLGSFTMIVRRLVYLLWCRKGRFVHYTGGGRVVGWRHLRLRLCNRVAVEQKFNTD